MGVGTMVVRGVIFLGSLIMLINIIQYIRFERHFTRQWGWGGQKGGLYFPILLLMLFLIGYVIVGTMRDPDPVMGAILLGGSVFVFAILQLMRSLADRVRQTEQLRVDLQAAEQASASKTVFLSNMSHDIRTPLNAIIGYARLAEEGEISEEQLRDYVTKIGVSGQQLMDLINDVLEMSQIENGKLQLEEATADLTEIADSIRTIFADQMSSKGLDFRVDAAGVTQPWVLCDRVRLSRVLINLVGNAYKFTPEGGQVELTLTQEPGDGMPGNPVEARGTGSYGPGGGPADGGAGRDPRPGSGPAVSGDCRTCCIRVRDTGIGMSPEFAEHVFDSFERERTSTVSGIQGTGLGMAITKSIVDLMGGSIQVDTLQGRGTTFTVRLCLPEAEAPIREQPVIAPGGAADCACGRRILLAEDVEINREIAGMILQGMGLCVECACNGVEAVRMLREAEPGYYDAVLMDIQMPVMDGYEATAAIRALEDPALAGIPIVAVTANAFAEDRRRALEAGMDGHVAKPLDPDQIRQALSRIFHGERDLREKQGGADGAQ